MTESVKDPRALVVTSQSQMLDKLQLSEVTHDIEDDRRYICSIEFISSFLFLCWLFRAFWKTYKRD